MYYSTHHSHQGEQHSSQHSSPPTNDIPLINVIGEYRKLLSELRTTSKPQIEMLSKLAGTYIGLAPIIVQTIEQELRNAEPIRKLPILYAIDCILKNVKGRYIQLIGENIPSNFYSAFHKVNKGTRSRLLIMRSTWEDIFPAETLKSIDIRCNAEDKTWSFPFNAPKSSKPSNNSNYATPNEGIDLEKEALRKQVEEAEMEKRRLEAALREERMAKKEMMEKIYMENLVKAISQDTVESRDEPVLEENHQAFGDGRRRSTSYSPRPSTSSERMGRFKNPEGDRGRKRKHSPEGSKYISNTRSRSPIYRKRSPSPYPNRKRSPSPYPNRGHGSRGPSSRGISPEYFSARSPLDQPTSRRVRMVDHSVIPLLTESDFENLEKLRKESSHIVHIKGRIQKVRFYKDVAIIMLDKSFDLHPREIYYDMPYQYPLNLSIDSRSILRVNFELPMKRPLLLTDEFDIPRKHKFVVRGKARNLYIDGVRHRAIGDDPVKINVNGRVHSLKFINDPPKFMVGEKDRTDLVAGMVNLRFKAENGCCRTDLYLDDLPQIIDNLDYPIIAQFWEDFRTITLNGKSFPVHFGGPPNPVLISTKKYELSFESIPQKIKKSIEVFLDSSTPNQGIVKNERRNSDDRSRRGSEEDRRREIRRERFAASNHKNISGRGGERSSRKKSTPERSTELPSSSPDDSPNTANTQVYEEDQGSNSPKSMDNNPEASDWKYSDEESDLYEAD